MELLPREKLASDFVEKIGLPRANRLLTMLSKRFDRRYKKMCSNSFSHVNPESVRQTSLEIQLTYDLKIGISINDTYNTPEAARNRTKARIEKRNARLQARKLALNT